jgi:hypothetical protein
VLELIRRARRRILHNELLCQGANAFSAALVAVILLLIAGTQILSWYWALLLPAAAIVVALYRVRKRLPSLYVTAQTVDRRMELTDSLSTAIFFESVGTAKRASPDLRRLQLAQADRMAETVDVRRAVPYTIPQTAYVAAALLLVASSVFALRYGLTERLDLKPSLAHILQQNFGWGTPEQKARLDQGKKPDKEPADDSLASSEQGDPNVSSDNGPQPDEADENYNASQDSKNASKADKNSQNQAQQDSAEDQAEKAEDSNAEGKQDSASNPKSGQQKGNEAQSKGNQASNAPQNGQSLLSKMKEAMQNLMSSLQQQPSQNASNQNGKNGKSQQNDGKQQSSKGEKKSGAQSDDAQEQQAADGQEAQNADGQATERADSALNNKQPGSGAGSRDGSKDVKQAEQLAAMGKITEIIGKRSQNVTGEATVDVQNTSQQLRTAYQERNAEHAQAGAEINRDEIPVALESYVAQYFERVRKQAKK